MKTTTKKQFTLNVRDFAKGLMIAVIAAILPVIQATIEAESLQFDWTLIGTVAVSALLAYLVKNFTEKTKVVSIATNANDASKLIAAASKEGEDDGQPPHPPSNPFYPKKKP